MRYNLIPMILASLCLGTISSCSTVPGKGLPLPPIQTDPTFNARQEIVQVDDSPFYIMHKDAWRKIDTMLINRETDRDTCRKMYEAQNAKP